MKKYSFSKTIRLPWRWSMIVRRERLEAEATPAQREPEQPQAGNAEPAEPTTPTTDPAGGLCPLCSYPFPHSYRGGMYRCDECGHEWLGALDESEKELDGFKKEKENKT